MINNYQSHRRMELSLCLWVQFLTSILKKTKQLMLVSIAVHEDPRILKDFIIDSWVWTMKQLTTIYTGVRIDRFHIQHRDARKDPLFCVGIKRACQCIIVDIQQHSLAYTSLQGSFKIIDLSFRDWEREREEGTRCKIINQYTWRAC